MVPTAGLDLTGEDKNVSLPGIQCRIFQPVEQLLYGIRHHAFAKGFLSRLKGNVSGFLKSISTTSP